MYVLTKRAVIAISHLSGSAFRFGDFQLSPDGTLRRGGREIHLAPKELGALRVLLVQAGRIVSPAQLKRALWGDVHVTPESVPRCVSSLRAALMPDECIQTVYKRGYRLTSQVERVEAATSQPRLAVMPFALGLDVPEHLGTAVAEETMARLSGPAGGHDSVFSVLARDSVFTLAEQGLTAKQLGDMLGADFVLTGSLHALAAQVRLRVEMIRVQDDTQVWVEDFLVERTRIAGVETELVERLLGRLGYGGLSLAGSADPREQNASEPARLEAYDLFQRGHKELRSAERHRMQQGLQQLRRATDLDPTLISAQVDVVNLCITQEIYGFMSPAVAAEQVRCTAKVLEGSREGIAAILPALGWIRFHMDYNLEGALEAFDGSSRMRHDPWAARVRVMFALSRKRFDEAIQMLEEALRADPYSPWLHARLGWAWHMAGDGARSLTQCEQALAMFPQHDAAQHYGAMILAFNGETRRAVELAERVAARSPHFDIATAIHGYALACAGRKDEAREIVERLQWLGRERYVTSSFTPAICVALDDVEGAMAELRSAEEAHCPWFFQMLADPRLKALHDKPQFAKMQNRLKQMEASLAQRAAD